MVKKVLVSDYDQTFYLNDLDIEKNKEAIKKFRAKNNLFVIATGRSYDDFMKKAELYKIKYDYVILNHGATIIDCDGEILENYYIIPEVLKKLKNDLCLEKTINYFCCSELESRVDFSHPNITKINVKYNTKADAINTNFIILQKYSNFVNSYHISECSLEIISNTIDKSKAISFLIEKLNISKEDIYTIGNGYSDINMVKDFNGYAMRESVDDLKKVAKKSVDSVSNLVEMIKE